MNVLACDTFGNLTYREYPFYYDSVAPSIYFNSNPSGWTGGNPTFSFGAWDATSGVAHIWYRTTTDGSNWSGWTESSSCTIYNGGWYQVQVMTCDNAGNYSTATSNWIGVDHSPPTCSYSPNSSGWTNNLNVSISSWDTWGSGLSSSYWRLSTDGGSTWSGYTQFGSSATISLPHGNDVLQTDVYDNVGNKSTVTSGHYYIDKIAPNGVITPSTTDYTPSLTLNFNATDADSGVNRVVNPDGSTVAGSSSSYTVTENGTYTFKAVDNAGNWGSFSYNVTNIAHGNLTGTIEVSDHYYENTDVTGAVDVQYTNQAPVDLTPAMGITLRITAGSQVITQTILCPPNNHSYIPFKFRTPDNPGSSSLTMTIKAEIDPDNKLHETNETDNVLTKQISIDNAEYTEPPATTYQPTAPSSWHETNAGSYPSTNTLSWQEWRFENNALVLKNFNVTAAATMQLTPDPRATSSTLENGIWTMRSGYGFGNTTTVHVTTNYDRPELITLPQRIRVYFPEFGYDQQNNLRELEQTAKTGTTADYTVAYSFKQNPQSKTLARLHFTPLWFPDGDYNVLENARDIWTPGGQLNMWGTTTLNISGSVYDDWYAGLVPNQ